MWKKKSKWNIHTQKKMEANDSNTNNGNVVFMIGTAFLTTWKNSHFVVRRKDKVFFLFWYWEN